jgi:hypothetical protein
MTQATSTSLGEIKLAGDLAGSNNALIPELTATGVTPGAYFLPSITVDAKGRITAASNGSVSEILNVIPDATKTQKGIAKIGDNIEVTTTATNGSQTIEFGGLLTGASLLGLCSNSPTTTYSFSVRVDGLGIQTVTGLVTRTNISDLITEINSKLVGATIGLNSGNLRIISSTTGTSSKILISNDNLFRFISGYVQINLPIDGMGESTIWVKDATTLQKGVAKLGTGFLIDSNGVANFNTATLALATTASKGVVQIGQGVAVSNGIISTTAIPDASTSVKGVVTIGQNINVSSGTISVPFASDTVAGVFKVGTGLKVVDGVLGLDTSAYATATTPGVIKVGSGLTVSNGVLSAGTSIASVSNLGMVKIGTGISVTGDGTISIAPGSIPDATYTSKGLVQIGSNIQVNSGVISLPIGSSTTPGICKVNTAVGLSVSNGVISAVLANGTNTFGVVAIGNTNNLTADSGVIDVGANIPKKNSANTYTKAQVVALVTPNFSNTMTLDLSQSNTFSFTATSDFTLANPSNVVAGGVYYIIVKQDSTGGRQITFGSNFKFRGVTPTLSSDPNATDVIAIIATGTSFLATEIYKGY